MIKHMVLFRFKSEITEEVRDNLLKEYVSFPKIYPAMRNFTLGRNISERDKTYEYAFSVEFESEADLKNYLNSPEHEEHVSKRFRPLVEGRAIVSYEVDRGEITKLF